MPFRSTEGNFIRADKGLGIDPMDPKSIVNGCGSVSSQLRGMELALEITGRPGIFGNAAVIGGEPESANVLRPTGSTADPLLCSGVV